MKNTLKIKFIHVVHVQKKSAKSKTRGPNYAEKCLYCVHSYMLLTHSYR